MTETNTDQKNEWKERELGALWIKEGRNQKFLSGHLLVEEMPGVQTKVKVVVFSNKGKSENERAPDYVVYRSVDREETATSEESSTEETQAKEQDSNEEIPASLV